MPLYTKSLKALIFQMLPPSPQDAVSVPALRDLIYAFGEMFLGGNFKTMHSHIGVVTDNMVMGTSAKV